MPRSLRGLVLAGALLLAGCSVGGQEASEPSEPKPITKAQLAAMVLPRDELGTIAQGTKPAADGGAVENSDAAASTLDPNDSGKSLRSAGRLAGHKAYFAGGDLAALQKGGGVFLVGTEVELLEDPVYAAQYLHKQLGDFERFQGKQDDGSTLSGASTFHVTGVGDEADGLRGLSTRGKQKLHLTAVVFRRARIVAVAAVVRADDDDAQGEARALAVKLDTRIQAVVAGDIPVGSPEAGDTTSNTAAATASRLPELTLQAEDVAPGAAAADEGELADHDYVGFQRTFEDVVVGGAHLIRLQAQTAAYEKPEQAARAHRLVSQAAGREIFADGIARAFGKETAVTPTDIRVRSFPTRIPGMPGVVATFNLVGAKFELVSIFVRSGRFIQSVTGICRPAALEPDDLTALARRAQARLTA